MEAQLRDAQEGLNDTYYDHAITSQNNALDKEQELYNKSRNDYLKDLREKFENIDEVNEMVNESISNVLANADIVLNELNTISDTYGITLSENLTNPWNIAAENALVWKDTVSEYLTNMTNADGVITVFGADTTRTFGNIDTAILGTSINISQFKTDSETNFGLSGIAASNFAIAVGNACTNISNAIGSENTGFTQRLGDLLKYPWNKTTETNGPINTFSNKVNEALNNAVKKAKNIYEDMKKNLEGPWNDMSLKTFNTTIETGLNKAVAAAKTAAAEIKRQMELAYASYENEKDKTPETPTPETPTPETPQTETKQKKKYYKYIKVGNAYYYECSSDANGKSYTGQYIRRSSRIAYGSKLMASANEITYHKSGNIMLASNPYKHPIIYCNPGYVEEYAKGTTGTKKDQWSIDSEPQWGDELVLVPNQGVLSYMRKGTSVIPADITENLMEWGQMNPNMMNMGSNIVQPVMNNVVTNNNMASLNFDSLVHIDNCSEESIDKVKQIVNDSLNDFARKLNYSLKRC